MFSLWNSLTLSFLFLFCSHAAAKTPKSENAFVIRVDPSVKTEELQVRYFVTGDFRRIWWFFLPSYPQQIEFDADWSAANSGN